MTSAAHFVSVGPITPCGAEVVVGHFRRTWRHLPLASWVE